MQKHDAAEALKGTRRGTHKAYLSASGDAPRAEAQGQKQTTGEEKARRAAVVSRHAAVPTDPRPMRLGRGRGLSTSQQSLSGIKILQGSSEFHRPSRPFF